MPKRIIYFLVFFLLDSPKSFPSEGVGPFIKKIEVPEEDLANPRSKKNPRETNKPKPNFLDKQNTYITKRIMGITTRVDSFVSRSETPSLENNNSFVVLNVEPVFMPGGEHDYNINLRGRADLPNTKKRMRLIFESQPDEDFSLSDQGRSGHVDSEEIASERSIAGVEYAKEVGANKWRPSIDLGTRLDFPVDTFVRLKFRRVQAVTQTWQVYTRVNLPYFAQRGAQPSMRIENTKKMGEAYVFRTMSHYKYTRRERLQEYFQSFQINQWVSPALTMEYKLGAFGDNKGLRAVKGYFAFVAAKRLIYDDWLYLSFIPEVNYLRQDDWAPSYRFTLQLRAVYAD